MVDLVDLDAVDFDSDSLIVSIDTYEDMFTVFDLLGVVQLVDP